MPAISSPSVANAMKALQNKIKNLEKDKSGMERIINNMGNELASKNMQNTQQLESEVLELREKSEKYIMQLKTDKEEFKKV